MAAASKIGSNTPGEQPTMRDFNLVLALVIGIAVVCALGFLTLLFTYFTQTHAAFQDLRDEVREQNIRINALTVEVNQINLNK